MKQQNCDITENLIQICDAPQFIEQVHALIKLLNETPKDPPLKPSKVQLELDRLGRVLDNLSEEAKAHLRPVWAKHENSFDEVLILFAIALNKPYKRKLLNHRHFLIAGCATLALSYKIPIVQTENSKIAWLIEIICGETGLKFNPYEIIREIRAAMKFMGYTQIQTGLNAPN